jgi:hypothetical protein
MASKYTEQKYILHFTHLLRPLYDVDYYKPQNKHRLIINLKIVLLYKEKCDLTHYLQPRERMNVWLPDFSPSKLTAHGYEAKK